MPSLSEELCESSISNELQRKNDIECYDKIMESHPNYLTIVFAYTKKFRGRLKIFFTTPKVKSILRNINHRIIFIVL